MRKKETPNPSRVRGRGVEVSETLFYFVHWMRDGLRQTLLRKYQKRTSVLSYVKSGSIIATIVLKTDEVIQIRR